MYKKSKYILLILYLIGLSLFGYHYYQTFNGNHFLGISGLSTKISAFFALIITIYFFLPREYKVTQNKLAFGIIVVAVVFAFMNLKSNYIYYQDYRHNKIMTEYKNIDCDKMQEKFAVDLKHDNLKLFIGGGPYNMDIAKKYNLEIFSNGTFDMLIGVGKNRNCYNDLVISHFSKIEDIDVMKSLRENITIENMN